MNETHDAVFCCLDNSYSLRRFLRIVFVFSWVNFLSKHTLCVPHVGSKLKKKKSYNSFAVNKMMTDLGCFVITEGHVSCSAVIITNYSIQLFSGFCEFVLFFVFTQRNVGQQKWPHWEFKDVPILCTIMHLQMGTRLKRGFHNGWKSTKICLPHDIVLVQNNSKKGRKPVSL